MYLVKDMVDIGIVDPLLVTKAALNNAVSVSTTILSTDCVISAKEDTQSCPSIKLPDARGLTGMT